MPSFPLLLLSFPFDARKNFLIDSVLASTPFSSFLLVSFFPPVFAGKTKKGEVETLATLIASPLLDLYRGRNAPLSLFFSRNRCRSEHRIRVIRAANFVFQQREGGGSVVPANFLSPFLTLEREKERERRRWRKGKEEIYKRRARPLRSNHSSFGMQSTCTGCGCRSVSGRKLSAKGKIAGKRAWSDLEGSCGLVQGRMGGIEREREGKEWTEREKARREWLEGERKGERKEEGRKRGG